MDNFDDPFFVIINIYSSTTNFTHTEISIPLSYSKFQEVVSERMEK